MRNLKTNKGMVNFFKSFGIKKAFLTDDIRVEAFEVRPHRMLDEKVREFNADHGLPLDQLVG